jgi:hypothetical protein
MTSAQIKRVLTELIKSNLFLCDATDGGMCLKNEKGSIIFWFKLLDDITTLKNTVDAAFKTIES